MPRLQPRFRAMFCWATNFPHVTKPNHRSLSSSLSDHRGDPVTVPTYRRLIATRSPSASAAIPHATARPDDWAPRPVSVLPLKVVQRIAAGEVITGLESVVQELVENSLDAEATGIKVDVKAASRTVTVQDDGFGILPEHGLPHIAKCNATSKLSSLKELQRGVPTLGFRGQGLWAIANLADYLYVSSRFESELCGNKVMYDNDGNCIESSIMPHPMDIGTTVSVGGLPWGGTDDVTGLRQCKKWLVNTALCHPKVSFVLSRDGKTKWKHFPRYGRDGETETRLRMLASELKISTAEFRCASANVEGVGNVEVIVGLPSTVHSSSRRWIVTGVDGRCVQMDGIASAVRSSCDVKKGRFPVAMINILTDGNVVNWNVSPKKSIIRFKKKTDEARVIETVGKLVRNALSTVLSSHDVDDIDISPTASSLSSGEENVRGLLAIMAEKIVTQGLASDSFDLQDDARVPVLRNGRVVSQVLNTYIVVEHSDGIMLVEQHVADERVIYEKLVSTWKEFVPLPTPVYLPNCISDEWVFTLNTLGFEVEHLEEDETTGPRYTIKAAPKVMGDVDGTVLQKLLMRIAADGSSVTEAAAQVSCAIAVKNGKHLGKSKMVGIVKDLMKCENAHTCPHGRPIFIELRTGELAGLFGRSWSPERVGGNGIEAVEESSGVVDE